MCEDEEDFKYGHLLRFLSRTELDLDDLTKKTPLELLKLYLEYGGPERDAISSLLCEPFVRWVINSLKDLEKKDHQ